MRFSIIKLHCFYTVTGTSNDNRNSNVLFITLLFFIRPMAYQGFLKGSC